MILGDILLIVEGLLIAFICNPYSITISGNNIFLNFLYFLIFAFGVVMIIIGIRSLKLDISNYMANKKRRR